MLDVWMTPGERGERFRRELLIAFTDQRFDAVVLRENFFKKDLFPIKELEAHYAPVRVIGASDRNPGGDAVILYRPRRASSAVR
jgi:hypothetical protein